jgi:hypothetical protein
VRWRGEGVVERRRGREGGGRDAPHIGSTLPHELVPAYRPADEDGRPQGAGEHAPQSPSLLLTRMEAGEGE